MIMDNFAFTGASPSMQYTIFDIPVLNSILQGLAIVLLKIFRWRIEGRPPAIPKYVMTAAPHTSNWDFPIGLAIMFALKMNLKWLGKDTLFRWPLGYLFKFLGGIPINRSKSGDVVAQSIQAFKNKERMILAIAPEGTRKKVHHWKTGFYYIAQGADVPIVMGFLDYAKKVGGIGPTILPTGDIEVDMKVIRGFYDGISGKIADK